MGRVFVTRQIPGKALEELKAEHEVEVYEAKPGEKIPREALLERVKGVEAILSLLTERIDKEVFEAAGEQLKVVANYAVGYDNVEIDEAVKRNIWVCNTPSDLGDAVAEFALALMLSLSRRVAAADKFTRAGKYKVWEPGIFLGQDLSGKTLGVVGVGTIGSVVAKRAKAVFDMKIVYCGRSRKEEFEKEVGAEMMELDELVKRADVISLHVPLTNETKHMISSEQFGMMKKEAIVINTSRGPVVNEEALVDALEKGQIWGAALDVYEEEVPSEKDHLDPRDWEKLKKFDNVILTPHIASATLQAREEMTRMAVDNILAALKGETPACAVKVGNG